MTEVPEPMFTRDVDGIPLTEEDWLRMHTIDSAGDDPVGLYYGDKPVQARIIAHEREASDPSVEA